MAWFRRLSEAAETIKNNLLFLSSASPFAGQESAAGCEKRLLIGFANDCTDRKKPVFLRTFLCAQKHKQNNSLFPSSASFFTGKAPVAGRENVF